jgi:hypothetical protein
VALGWGLWEGPASLSYGPFSAMRLTLTRSGFNIALVNKPRAVYQRFNEAASHHRVSISHSRRFSQSCMLWHFCAYLTVALDCV